MKGKEVLEKFNLKTKEEPISIYPFSPVYKFGEQIIKRTAYPLEKAENLQKYLTFLQSKQIDVVKALELNDAKNPQELGEDCYVVYPFIEGTSYSGKDEEIIQAGQLLGKLHKHSPINNHFDLPVYSVFDFNEQEVLESMEAIQNYIEKFQLHTEADRLQERLLQAVQNQKILSEAPVRWLATPYDFKANNLIYQNKPVLIDPDHARWVPQVFDLALVLWLFHNEHEQAPHRVFTEREWNLFLDGYRSWHFISEQDKKLWTLCLEHIFLDEVMWMLAELDEDWEREEQRLLFQSLISLMVSGPKYHL
ncbi:phosphotransferase [Alkalihalobacillus pseudalcaliphilus]|uniref:phosphotransferase n=1 Tax=Alkalihalobacillus pseudalcaliphilus TaxID=79884 RepID=UPI00064DC78F|nr:phosphotransferase [Alkalihalobacillus pseudalcaliphilus]KMK76193.1 serine kinase [Alkalihalobacillus pseudalcaliphilus]